MFDHIEDAFRAARHESERPRRGPGYADMTPNCSGCGTTATVCRTRISRGFAPCCEFCAGQWPDGGKQFHQPDAEALAAREEGSR